MHHYRNRKFCLFILILPSVTFLFACGTTRTTATLMSLPQAIIATLTSSSAPSATSTHAPTSTLTQTPTPTPTNTLTPTITPSTTPEPTYTVLRGIINQEHVNCCYGPSKAYLYKYGLLKDNRLDIIGYMSDTGYIEVQAIGGDNPCWMNLEFMEVQGTFTP